MLAVRDLHKAFGQNPVLTGVDLRVEAGEVHVLFGENGAGKSTLINIVTGMLKPDAGTITFKGRDFTHLDPNTARDLGIATVFQEFSLVPQMSVAENLYLGREPTRGAVVKRGAMNEGARQVFERLEFRLDVAAKVGDLSRAEQQMVEIAKATMTDAALMIFDEPTASLTDSEADHVLATIRRLAAKGLGIIYISHRLREIRAIANRVTVLRTGKSVGTIEAADVSEDRLVEMMTGRKIEAFYPKIPHAPAAVRLELRKLSTTGGVQEISLTLRGGEIVGLAGLVGCGKGEIGRAVYGLSDITGGEVLLDDQPVDPASPRAMLRRGLCYFPADRNSEGLGLNLSVVENVASASLDEARYADRFGQVREKATRDAADAAMTRLKLKPLQLNAQAHSFSGGNRQKVMLGRALMRDIDVFIFDEPTVGIDVGAKVEVYDFLATLVARGAAVLLISSELLEVTSLSNRIYVVHHGRIVRELVGPDCTQENVLASFFGDQTLQDAA